jgi:6-phosphogluconolactonase/glucosamine-6-phosphate isomerase/deaminase
VAFLVSGESKAVVLNEILEAQTSNFPAKRISPTGELTWFVDHAAAKLLKRAGK